MKGGAKDDLIVLMFFQSASWPGAKLPTSNMEVYGDHGPWIVSHPDFQDFT